MKQATKKLYIHFGEIPEDGKSRIHASDDVIGVEAGLSVYRAVEANGLYFPVLPDDANESGVMDYFNYLFRIKEQKIFLLTGIESRFTGQDKEPLLVEYQIIGEVHYVNLLEAEE